MRGPSIFFLFAMVISGASLNCHQSSSRKTIYYINSYHQGYAASDSVMQGIRETLSSDIELSIFYLDAKRLTEEGIRRNVQQALAQIKDTRPELIIASDDDAVKRVIVPHFKNKNIPVVFCGVNWTAASYGLPTRNITGMLEVLPLRQTIQAIKDFNPAMKKLVVLSENSVSEQKNKDVLDTLYRNVGFETTYRLVETFDAWKKAFIESNQFADLIYIPTNGAIKNWDKEAAKAFVAQHIQRPVITCDDFMMPYAVLGFTKVAKEQGQWAAQTALQILGGVNPQTIPLAKNKQVRGWLNERLASKLNVHPGPALLNNLSIIERIQR